MTDTFLGLPVNGTKMAGADPQVEQYPLEQFSPILQALLDDPRVRGIKFTAYTPYFNDGDPCVFHVNEPYFLIEGAPEDAESSYADEYGTDEDEDGGEYLDEYYLRPLIGKHEYHYDGKTYVDDGYQGPDEAFHNKIHAFSDALTDGHFDNVILEAFGDHATVTITRDGIDIEFCEHD